jgi:hypothetical protein
MWRRNASVIAQSVLLATHSVDRSRRSATVAVVRTAFGEDKLTVGSRLELFVEVGDGMKGKGGVSWGCSRLHFSTEGVIRRDRQ